MNYDLKQILTNIEEKRAYAYSGTCTPKLNSLTNNLGIREEIR